ncbi:UNVERIFIED_CONTAM: hypothetical protein HDU68_003018 [Siphonaria sp. JEL0065]|nr:hypothetical protein HDU68_003018 [Siphonaria sp. JEL0065]
MWLFRNKKHKDYSVADALFSKDLVSSVVVGEMLGYPSSNTFPMTCEIEYMHGLHESECALEYQANLHADIVHAVHHFSQCSKAVELIGLELTFRLGGREFSPSLMSRIQALPSDDRIRAYMIGVAYFINSTREIYPPDFVLGDDKKPMSRGGPFEVLAFMSILENPVSASDRFIEQLCATMKNPYVFDLICVEMAAFEKVSGGKGGDGKLEAWVAQRLPQFERFVV